VSLVSELVSAVRLMLALRPAVGEYAVIPADDEHSNDTGTSIDPPAGTFSSAMKSASA
jgi:hypothetical protein